MHVSGFSIYIYIHSGSKTLFFLPSPKKLFYLYYLFVKLINMIESENSYDNDDPYTLKVVTLVIMSFKCTYIHVLK